MDPRIKINTKFVKEQIKEHLDKIERLKALLVEARLQKDTWERIKCPNCGIDSSANFLNCYNCLKRVYPFNGAPSFQYKLGKHYYTPKEMAFANDYEDNPDFIKAYGNPFTKKQDFGSKVDEMVKATGKSNADKFVKKLTSKKK